MDIATWKGKKIKRDTPELCDSLWHTNLYSGLCVLGTGLGGGLAPAQVANVTGVSPILSANTNSSYSSPATLAKFHDAPINKPLGPVQNRPNVQSPSKSNHANYLKTCNGDGRPPL